MSPFTTRIPPLAPEDFNEEQKEVVGDWTSLNFSLVYAHNPELYRILMPLIKGLVHSPNLPGRDKEILIIRTLAQVNEFYEAAHHVLFARNAGMSNTEIEAVKADGEGLSDFDRLLMKAADQLMDSRLINDETWAALAERYSQPQLMEVVSIVGCYDMLAMATMNFGIPLEQQTDSFDELAELRNFD